MHRILRQYLRTFGLALFTGATLAYIGSISHRLHSGEIPSAYSDMVDSRNGPEQNYESSLLIDSIVSIVQSYYVDADRTENYDLLKRTIVSLGDYPFIHETHSDTNFDIEVNGKHHIVTVDPNISYEALISEFVSIASFIEANTPKRKSSHSEAWYGRGDVTLLNALLSALDAHSNLLSEEGYRELKQGTEGAFGGVGVVVSLRNGVLTVSKPIPNSPAQRAGVKRNDQIVAIDVTPTFGFTLDQLVDYMRGSPGSSVEVTILGENAFAPRVTNMKRELVTVDSVTQDIQIKDNRKFLRVMVESFSSRTSDEISEALVRFRAINKGKIEGVILDLRSNPGGLLDQAVEVANLFIDSGILVSTRGRREEVEASHEAIKQLDFPMVVLVNEDSASASEIVAGALQDHQRAVIVGQPSFGKGSVQTIFELPGQQALKLTIARYYTPSGKSIQNTGIIPDVWLQPLIARTENANLLGTFRYKNERFLKNRLEPTTNAEIDIGSQSLSAKSLTRSLKAYYLQKPDSEEARKDDMSHADDHELEIARDILGATRALYPNSVNAGANRSNHWLAVATPKIQPTLDKLNDETKQWLSDEQRIRWEKNDTEVRSDDLSIDLIRTGTVEAIQGEVLELPWKITNNSQKKINRVSIFATTLYGNIEPVESLVGQFDANEVRRGVIQIKIPASTATTVVPSSIRIGVAVDATALDTASVDLAISAKPRTTASLAVDVIFQDGANSKHLETVEPSEEGEISIDIENRGVAPGRNVTARLINLAGTQINTPDTEQHLGDIDSGSHKRTSFKLKADPGIKHEDLFFGLIITSPDLDAPVRQSFKLKGITKNDALEAH